MTTHTCPIRGHHHELSTVKHIQQQGSGQLAQIVECPTGRYRWFVLEGRTLSDLTRMKRPRWGWRD